MTRNSTRNCAHRAAIGVRELFRLVTPTMAVGVGEFRLPLHYDGRQRPVNCSVRRAIRANRRRSPVDAFDLFPASTATSRPSSAVTTVSTPVSTANFIGVIPSPCRSRPVCNSGKTSGHQIRAARRSINTSTRHSLRQVTEPFFWPSWRLR